MEVYKRPKGIETRWVNFENPKAEKGGAAKTNRGAKGYAFDRLLAGESRTLMDVTGSGIITRMWFTVGDRSPEMMRSLKLEMYWDGADKPAVSVPFGDFFCIALGRRTAFENRFFSDPEGKSFNCFIPMPFKKGAKIIITNESKKNLIHLFYEINFLINVEHDEDTLYFHSHFRRENPNKLGEDYTILPKVEGTGRFLGCNVGINVNPIYKAWWGEGEFKVWLDGDDANPTLCGTGAEDFVGTGWGLGTFANRTQGCLIADHERKQWCFYRFHVDDPIFFYKDCRVAIQTIGGTMIDTVIEMQRDGVPLIPVSIDMGEQLYFKRLLELPQPVDLTDPQFPKGWCNIYRQDDWSSTAYFYLDSPVNSLPPIPPVEERVEGLAQGIDGSRRDDV